jgi:hypothetical protein
MKPKTILIILLFSINTAKADLPVIDFSVLANAIQEVELATKQLHELATEVRRLGDPASVFPVGAAEVIRSLNQLGVGKTWNELRGLADGFAAMAYDGQGLYQPVGRTITTADGQQFERPAEDYKKFDAIAKATRTLEEVMKDTENRRQGLRDEIRATTAELRVAQTVSEVQKLQGVLNAQAAELAAIDREREGALNRVLLQTVENEADAAKQAQARQEERIVDFQAAQQKLMEFLVPDTSPVILPDPRAIGRH